MAVFALPVGKKLTASSANKIAQQQSKPTPRWANVSEREAGPFVEQTWIPNRGSAPAMSWDFAKIPVFPPERPSTSHTPAPLPGFVQHKLAIGQVDDRLEHEADHVADQVMRMPIPEASVATAPPLINRKCESCAEEEERIQRKQAQRQIVARPVSGLVHEVVRSPGQPLDPETLAYFQPRFRRDFSMVRVHSDGAAQQSARDLRAHAYTVGHNIVFGAGAFAPGMGEGRRLIAHELAHVVQQTGASAGVALQRDSKKEEKPVAQDVAVLLSPDKNFVTRATTIAPGAKVLHATSVDDLAKQLKAIKVPIKTLYFIAHMDEDGDLLFTSPGQMTYVPAATIASKIKDSAQVESIDFQGCTIGQAPAEMDKIRVALKASKATGSTCTLVTQTADPIIIGGKAITRPEDLTDKKVKTAFEAGLKKVRELFVDAKKKCIINDSTDGYFQTGGRLIAVWANPGSMADDDGWDDKKSICYKDLKVEKIDPTKKLPVIGPDDCKLVEVGNK
jgi:hypothetical protein